MKEKTLGNVDPASRNANVPDVEVFGKELWVVLCKASSREQGWMKTTKAMQVHRGCLVQTETQQRNPDGSYALSQALVFVPKVYIANDLDAKGAIVGRSLVEI